MSAWASRLVVLSALWAACAGGARVAWVWQANCYKAQLARQADEYSRQLAYKDRAYSLEREMATAAVIDQLTEQQEARLALETRLQAQTKTHWKEMEDAKQAQARLRDRLATSDLQLSIIVDAGFLANSGCGSGLRKATGTGGVVHGAIRAQLDRAHAQRIVAITEEGDRGIAALKACQSYVREIRR